MSRCQPGSRLQVLSLDSRTGSGGRLSAAGITCQGYAEWTQNKAHGAAEGDSRPADASWPVLSLFSFQEESRTRK